LVTLGKEKGRTAAWEFCLLGKGGGKKEKKKKGGPAQPTELKKKKKGRRGLNTGPKKKRGRKKDGPAGTGKGKAFSWPRGKRRGKKKANQ